MYDCCICISLIKLFGYKKGVTFIHLLELILEKSVDRIIHCFKDVQFCRGANEAFQYRHRLIDGAYFYYVGQTFKDGAFSYL